MNINIYVFVASPMLYKLPWQESSKSFHWLYSSSIV